jgi:hypothetical protein
LNEANKRELLSATMDRSNNSVLFEGLFENRPSKIISLTFSITGVKFTNILCTAFTLVDPESIEKIENLKVFFTLLRSACLKSGRRTLMKLSPGVVCLTPLFYAVIWYERFGNDNRRTLVSESTYFFIKKRTWTILQCEKMKAL